MSMTHFLDHKLPTKGIFGGPPLLYPSTCYPLFRSFSTTTYPSISEFKGLVGCNHVGGRRGSRSLESFRDWELELLQAFLRRIQKHLIRREIEDRLLGQPQGMESSLLKLSILSRLYGVQRLS